MPRTPGETIPRQFRLDNETLEDMDWLVKRYKLASRTAVIKLLVQLARRGTLQVHPPQQPEPKPKKSSRKSTKRD